MSNETKGLGNPAVIGAIASNPKAVEKITDTTATITKIIVPVALIGVAFLGYKAYKFFFPKTLQETAQDLADEQSELNNVTTNLELQTVAINLAKYLGRKPYSMFEEDEKTADLVIAYRNSYSKIAELYAIYCNHNLTQDLINLLDDSELDRVRLYINI